MGNISPKIVIIYVSLFIAYIISSVYNKYIVDE
jgi:hypothetical protein